MRHVVGHQRAVVPNFFVDARGPQHVDAAVVDEGFAEIQAAAFDVAEVHIEDLLARSEVANHVVDLLAWLFELLRHGALTEVQAVIRAFLD